MQLGARWRAGETPHRSVPSALHQAILEQEGLHPDATAWTLTWLEGRPRCELDTLVLISLDQHGRVRAESQPSELTEEDSDDSWLD